ncbi:MAG: FtsQ-type POTRA domain-containing protein [Clostridiales bacterium]|nr:FtsQ-type POTRA domain-containing protein [Clostridiales bacterium]
MRERTPPANLEQYRLHKRRAGNFRWVLIALLFLICAACGYFFSVSPFFGVEQVTVSGNDLVGAQRLRALSGIEISQNIFTVDTAVVERWLCIEPLIETAQVKRILPRTVSITVTERCPAAVLATGQAFIHVDDSGLVLRRLRELDNIALPILSGIAGIHPGAVPGSRIEGEDMDVALTVLHTLPSLAFPSVKEIDVTDNQKIRLYTEGGIEVRVGGSGNMAEKYLLADSIIYNAQLNGTASKIGYIDVSSTEKPVVYYLNQ